MNLWQSNNVTACFVEIGDDFLKASFLGKSLELRLARRADFSLEPGSRNDAAMELQKLLHPAGTDPKLQVYCALPARGISLRKLALPRAAQQERRALLELQVESEFPLSPAELAWGFVPLNDADDPARQQFLVAAVRKEAVRDYTDLFRFCRLPPVFTPAALARIAVLPKEQGSISHLEIGTRYSELINVEDGIPASIRVLHCGVADLNQVREPVPAMAGTAADSGAEVNPATTLADALGATFKGKKLFVTCAGSDSEICSGLLRLRVPAEALKSSSSLAIEGMQQLVTQKFTLLSLNGSPSDPKNTTREFPAKLVTLTAILVLAAALFPYFAAAIHKPFLQRKMAALKSDRGRLAMIDSELEFLRHLKQSQPPYIDALYLISRSVPPGTKLDTLSLTRRGELALRGTFQNANQVAEFRSKLLDSGFFSNIALEEQAPSPDRQKLTARLSATWRSDQMKETANQLAAKEPEKPKGTSSLMGGGQMMMGGDMPPGGFPGGAVRMSSGSLPPGMTLPPGAVPVGMEARSSTSTTQRTTTGRISPPGMVSPSPEQPVTAPTTPIPVPAPQLRSPNP